MPKQPLFQLPLNDNVLVGLVVGDNQVLQPITYGVFKSAIISQSQKVGTVTFSGGTFSVSFTTPIGNANFQIAWTELPDDVNPDKTSYTRTVNGFSGTYIGEGSGDGGFIAAVNNN